MGNAALKTPERLQANHHTRQHEKLVRELHSRLLEISRQEPSKDGLPVPTPVLKAAANIGYTIIGLSYPHPPTLNVAASVDGEVLFSVLGVNRSADVWIDSDDGAFGFVARDGDKPRLLQALLAKAAEGEGVPNAPKPEWQTHRSEVRLRALGEERDLRRRP